MKLATYRDGSRDGQLVVVSRDLSTAHYASGIATRLQQVLDDWNFLSPQLEDLSQTLNHGKASTNDAGLGAGDSSTSSGRSGCGSFSGRPAACLIATNSSTQALSLVSPSIRSSAAIRRMEHRMIAETTLVRVTRFNASFI